MPRSWLSYWGSAINPLSRGLSHFPNKYFPALFYSSQSLCSPKNLSPKFPLGVLSSSISPFFPYSIGQHLNFHPLLTIKWFPGCYNYTPESNHFIKVISIHLLLVGNWKSLCFQRPALLRREILSWRKIVAAGPWGWALGSASFSIFTRGIGIKSRNCSETCGRCGSGKPGTVWSWISCCPIGQRWQQEPEITFFSFFFSPEF